MLKIEKENLKKEQSTALELERTKLEVMKAQLAIARLNITNKDSEKGRIDKIPKLII